MPSYTCLFPFAVSWNKSWLRWNSGPIWWQGWFFFARWRLLQLRIVCKHTLLRHSTLCSALPTAWFITTVNLVFIETVFLSLFYLIVNLTIGLVVQRREMVFCEFAHLDITIRLWWCMYYIMWSFAWETSVTCVYIYRKPRSSTNVTMTRLPNILKPGLSAIGTLVLFLGSQYIQSNMPFHRLQNIYWRAESS